MKVSQRKNQQKDIFEMLPQAFATLKKNILTPFFSDNLIRKYANEKPPLRAELFSAEQNEQYAKVLAKNHALISESLSEQLLRRLAENEDVLLEVHKLITESVKENTRIAPAAEWLLDNFYLIEEQVYTGKKHLPKGYSKGLPKLVKGASEGLPRVYDIALEIISHSDGRVDLKSLSGFITAYQKVTTLNLGELWAIPIMLRLALIENLRRLAVQIAIDITNKKLAGYWADEMTEAVEKDPKSLVLVIADMARSDPPMVSSFVAELTRRLQEKGSSLTLPLSWVEQRLSENGLTSAELVQQENQKQAAEQVSISNSISSLRFLSTNDWREFVENTSIVEQILRQDSNEVYANMDFFTRDQYRHAVEKIAKSSSMSEQEIATMIIQLAKESAEKNDPDYRKVHVGYYLTGKGLIQTEKLAKVKLTSLEIFKKIYNKNPLLYYTGGIVFLTAFMCWGLLAKAYADESRNWMLILCGLVSIFASSQLAITVINWLATVLARPHLLPRLDFSKGIPAQYRSLVVVPTLLNNNSDVENLLESLEVHFLANRDEVLHFALLTDFPDASVEKLPEDEPLLQFAKDKIVELNKKYERTKNDIFFLFHRPRRWNAKEKKWMGYERKRGKLEELNGLLRGRSKDCFSLIVGDEEIFSIIKYVITLDTDTQLPRDSAWKMIGTIAHPLNHALYSEKKHRVTEGYTILQPRVSNSLPGINNSMYARIHGNEPGTDPYTRAISDVYQDLFQEGSFIGKGIYDVDTFERTLKNRFPDNRILSHDLLEGCYARSGLISDVQLYEEYPSRYYADIKRRHRWIRGDWQIISWVFPFVPGHDRHLHRNPLSALSRWKIFDNLRRSLVPLSLLLLLLYGWIFSSAAWFWTLSVTVIMMLSPFITFFWEIYKKPSDVLWLQHTIYSIRNASNHFFQHIIYFICLPYEAYINTGAIVQTMWRMLITHRKLLEWNPSNYVTNQSKNLFQTYMAMWFAPFFATCIFAYLTFYSPLTLVIAMPILILWGISPFVTWWVSLSITKRKTDLSYEQNVFLHNLARKIWAFFENFVGAEDNWLPPDNYQEHPAEKIAHRTSPTNIGLNLLANLTAYDFGYITAGQLIERTTHTISTMQRMEKYRGHLYNWYDTRSLEPLHPKYISTVDSGNLAGHLITLEQGLLNVLNNKIATERVFDGLLDTVRILSEKIKENSALQQFQQDLEKICFTRPVGLAATKKCIDLLESSFVKIFADLNSQDDSYWWGQRVAMQIRNVNNDLNTLTPWLLLPPHPIKFGDLIISVAEIPTILSLSKIEINLLSTINSYYVADNTAEENGWLDNFRACITEAGRHAKELVIITERLAQECIQLSNNDYDFLYDRTQHLLSIGYNVDERRKDNSFYDMLASEARLTTFVAIAQGKLPQESWFALGRQLTSQSSSPVLLSWSGSMFEYLMPLLIMPGYENTLLDQTSKAIVQKQIEYGKKRGVPWGISESGYNLVDANLNYQYRAFGVPGLGFKRGLGEDLVISPYSSIIALMVAPQEAYQNLKLLKEKGFEGKYGFFEAIDYTSSRLPRRQTYAVVRSFMAHHQGMSFLAIANLLFDQPMQKRFESEVQVKATLLLLQERIPRITAYYSPSVHIADTNIVSGTETPMRVINTPNTPIPEIQLLSNGRYHVMITNAGGGYSRWKNIAITRWREDSTCDNRGTFCFIRDVDNNTFWSSAYQPALQQGENYEAVFSQGRAEFRRRDYSLETHTEIVVSPEDDVELRRVHIINRSRRRRTIEVTSYTEVALANQAADEMHPAFSNLFVQTEIITPRNAIICTRRPRSVEEQVPWMFHLMKAHNAEILDISYETDRVQFIGRGNTINNPDVMNESRTLSGSEGSVLDPVISIRYRIIIEPNESAIIEMVYGIAETRDICNGLIEKYQDQHLINRAFELAWTHSQVILRQINAIEADAQLYGRLASSIIFANSSLRTDPSIIIKNRRGQSGLWSYSVSGDLPILILQIEDSDNIELVKQLMQAHAYWRLKGLIVDLMIWNEDHGGYRQILQNQILGLITPGTAGEIRDQPGGIFIRSADQISNEDRILFQTVARVVISDKLGSLEEQINRKNKLKPISPFFSPTKFYASLFTSVSPPNDLQFFNGTGGFSNDGKEYVIITTPSKTTPVPWINVLANPNFGTIVSESGQSYTWIENAHELRLTPWNNDPVSDLAGEAFYLRDEESGKFWSPMPLPCRGKSPYITRHGFGYSVFEHSEDGINSEAWVYTDIEAPVKFIVLKLHNLSNRPRRISVTGYVEWVLADLRPKSIMHIVTEFDIGTGAIFAKNAYNPEFENRIAFFDVDDNNKTFTTDRTEFIGRNGTLKNPDAMNRARLSGKTGAALDPCAVIQFVIDLSDGEEREIVFRLGVGKDANDAVTMINQFKGSAAAGIALEQVKTYWQKTLSAIQIETPDSAINMLTNGWLTYQTLSCRLWGRSGFYQSGGAFGFRDQLQDVLSLIHCEPTLARRQLILCASRQFKEGDVQHWWHPPSGRGVRTTCSDDFLWLPFVTSKYISAIADLGVLDESVYFIEGRLLNAGEESYYDLPIRSDKSASLYDHCVKAIEHALVFGEHGLPLIGSGDWNDGMDKVGIHHKGESVWLAFFLYDILMQFSEIARVKNDTAFLEKCRQNAEQLCKNIEKHAWDGEWYRRAWFDDGTPLGSATNTECKIDSIAQSWSVLSKGGNSKRSLMAMESANKYLVRKQDTLIQLFDPPFDKSDLNPGYIKGYVPGVRENGGQYTHAAIWMAMAFAALGDKVRTWELLKIINPVNHGSSSNGIATYKVEPYVMAADVYAEKKHKGRGGWTWYTGSAGWMYQLIIGSFLGINRKADKLEFTPCIPAEWKSFKVNYRYMETNYHLSFFQPAEKNDKIKIGVDGNEQKGNSICLVNDKVTHEVTITF
jgi:cyclic beta-1,2-glucan glucanotransferase